MPEPIEVPHLWHERFFKANGHHKSFVACSVCKFIAVPNSPAHKTARETSCPGPTRISLRKAGHA